ncbi:hypothetical protein [Merismopedia glauca]|uniref:Uncharacterized protein n=1 Tax=Merismopedia glauca CCAP 1448/3 TaxID=1296344 RepID=A0A2T1CAQ3_9CYAN|nr:hypothetical protein [Merismopedia glauca]PSB05243.1 hypothetical protein C7B64_00100 [Merismopedia glauca CCAP 1448/3]
MATGRRNLKDVITSEGEKLNNTAAKDDSDGADTDKQDLAEIVAELKAALAAANQKEDALQKQITSLQTEMHEQKVQVEKLERLELKSELDEAKQTALKLAEKNSELQAEIKALKAEKSDKSQKAEKAEKLANTSLKNRDRSIYDRPIGYADHRPDGEQNRETGDRKSQSNFKMWLD